MTQPRTGDGRDHPASLMAAVLWTCGTLTSMLLMGIAARELSAEMRPHHMAVYRNLIPMAVLIPVVIWLGRGAVASTKLTGHMARSTVHFSAQWCWFFGLGALPLAEVFAVEFSAPIWAALLAALMLGERLTRQRIAAIALGFAGILVLLRPGVAIVDPASLVVLMAALGFAVTIVITRSLMRGESALAVIFWMNLMQLPLGLVLSGGLPDLPTATLLPWLGLLGLAGLGSHFCLSQALKHGDVSVVAPLDFVRLPLGALIGWLAYDEGLDPFLALGAALIVAGNWINLRRPSA